VPFPTGEKEIKNYVGHEQKTYPELDMKITVVGKERNVAQTIHRNHENQHAGPRKNCKVHGGAEHTCRRI
jgi:hypothetical protein